MIWVQAIAYFKKGTVINVYQSSRKVQLLAPSRTPTSRVVLLEESCVSFRDLQRLNSHSLLQGEFPFLAQRAYPIKTSSVAIIRLRWSFPRSQVHSAENQFGKPSCASILQRLPLQTRLIDQSIPTWRFWVQNTYQSLNGILLKL